MSSVPFKVAVLMTAGRYENTYCRNVIESAIRESGLRLSISLGVFYGQCMQEMMNDVFKEGCQLIVTVDGDSIFNATHIDRLIQMIANNEHIDALASMQARRGVAYPLFTVGSSTECKINVTPDEPFSAVTAHFGLTAIRASSLAKMPKPWFHSTPSPEGDWGKESGKVDDDIYFWRKWKEVGNTLYVDPGCRIGHMEEMVVYYDDDLQLHHGYPSDWHAIQRRKRGLTEKGAKVRKLNIGGSTNPLEGYEVVDRKDGSEAYPLAFDEELFDEVHASHILEHFSRKQAPDVIAEWVRVLKPGGILQVAVPDIEWLISNHSDPLFIPYLFGGQMDENDFHKSAFNTTYLTHIMSAAGLSDIKPWNGIQGECSSLPVSLNLQGLKR